MNYFLYLSLGFNASFKPSPIVWNEDGIAQIFVEQNLGDVFYMD